MPKIMDDDEMLETTQTEQPSEVAAETQSEQTLEVEETTEPVAEEAAAEETMEPVSESAPTTEASEQLETVAKPAKPNAKKTETKKNKEKTAYNAAWPKAVGRNLDDDVSYLNAVDPLDAQKAEVTMMQKAIKSHEIRHAQIYGVEPAKDEKSVTICGKDGNMRVMFDATDFFAYSNMENLDKDDVPTRSKRYLRKAARQLNSKVSYIPLKVGVDSAGCPYVIGGRALAMEALQDKYFFSNKALATKGAKCTASILAAGPRYVTVECLGIETVIGSGGLSAFEYLADVSQVYHPGDGLAVIIEKLEVDKTNRKVDIRLSHALLQRLTTNVPQVDDSMKKGRYIATVLHETEKYFIICLDGLKIRGIVPKEYAKVETGGEPITVGCKVAMLVNNIDKDRNMVIGSCMRVG